MEYFVWKALAGKGAAVLTELKNVDNSVDIKRGRKLLVPIAKDAYFEMNPQYPKDILLEDQVSNMDYMVVVSPKLTEFLIQSNLAQVEYFPVSIKNHKGVPHQEKYTIVHPTKVIDCIDKSKSDLMWNKIDPDIISGCYELVLDTDKIGEDDIIFRAKHLETFVIVREDLAEEIKELGFTGVNMKEIDEFEA